MDILTGNLKENNIVQKSRSLLLMKAVPFELGELKVLDTYLSRINSRDPENRSVTFRKKEYEELMGLKETRVQTLKKYTKSMLSKVVEIPNGNGGFSQFTLFETADYEKDEYGEWTITLSCSTKAKKVFFNIEEIGYIRYRLKNVLSLNSRYSIFLYLYLLDNRFRSTWSIDVDELREGVFRCDSEYYKEFKWFNKDILKKSILEVYEKTDVKATYETEKRGRRVASVKFKITTKTEEIAATATELPVIDRSDEYENERFAFLAGACDYAFNNDEMRCIFDAVVLAVPESIGPYGIEIDRYDYLVREYNRLKLRESQTDYKPVKNRLQYFLKLITPKE